MGAAGVVGGLLLLAAAGCAAQDPGGPPTIVFGEASCAHCRMLVTEARYAGVAVAGQGDVLPFDDLQCWLRYLAGHPGTVRRSWVHEYDSAGWLDPATAFFVASRELATPMGGGLIALSTLDRAEALAEQVHGRVQHLSDLISTH